MVKEHLKRKRVKYEDCDVSRDELLAEEMVRKSGQMGVPVVDINGRILVGYRPGDIDKLLSHNRAAEGSKEGQ
jgi:glutaredoxin